MSAKTNVCFNIDIMQLHIEPNPLLKHDFDEKFLLKERFTNKTRFFDILTVSKIRMNWFSLFGSSLLPAVKKQSLLNNWKINFIKRVLFNCKYFLHYYGLSNFVIFGQK